MPLKNVGVSVSVPVTCTPGNEVAMAERTCEIAAPSTRLKFVPVRTEFQPPSRSGCLHACARGEDEHACGRCFQDVSHCPRLSCTACAAAIPRVLHDTAIGAVPCKEPALEKCELENEANGAPAILNPRIAYSTRFAGW